MADIHHLSYTIRVGVSMQQRRDQCQQVRAVREKGPHVTTDDEAMIARGRGGYDGRDATGRSRGRLADEVYDTLLGQLMSLRIEPGSRVTIDVLA